MSPFLQVLALALLPALGNFAGGLLAELFNTSRRNLSRSLHLAAGIVVAVVAVELLPEALKGASPWLVVMGFCLGGAAFIAFDFVITRVIGNKDSAGPWIIYTAVFFDLFSDGLMIGVGSTVSISLALILAIGQVTADAPEGFATIANFRSNGVARARRLALAASLIVAPLLGASIGYWLLRGQHEAFQLTALAFTAGLLILAAVEEMLGEAHETADDTHITAAFFIGGFALFVLVTSYFSG